MRHDVPPNAPLHRRRSGRLALIIMISLAVLGYPIVLLTFNVPVGMVVAVTTAVVLLALEAARQVLILTGQLPLDARTSHTGHTTDGPRPEDEVL